MNENLDIVLDKVKKQYFKEFVERSERLRTEEDLRVMFSSLIDKIANENGLRINEEHHEFTVIKGRIDSLYGEVVLEYKEPNYLSDSNSSSSNLKALQQVKTHIQGVEQKQKMNINRLLGVIFDGTKVIFLRRRNGIWDIEDPILLTEESFGLLLKRLFSTGSRGKALIIDNLIQDFSVSSGTTKKSIKYLYENFDRNNSGKVNLLFEQWKILFREVCGYDFDTKKLEIVELINFFDLNSEERDLSKIIFCIHTYYAVFIKLLGVETLTYYRSRDESFISKFSSDPAIIKELIQQLESGVVFKAAGINNYIEADFFSWYLLCWDNSTSTVLQDLIEKFRNYDFSSLNLEPKEAKDLIKNIYHFLLPSGIRHSMGEYYTPDWLAEFVINKLDINYSNSFRVLDPTCGSGTFLNLLIENIKNVKKDKNKSVLDIILNSVVGIDLNPLAVISAKTNYIIALSEYLEYIGDEGINIPIYLSDSMLAPLEYKSENMSHYGIPTKVGLFKLPNSLLEKERFNLVLDMIIESVENELPLTQFSEKLTDLGLYMAEIDFKMIEDFYSELLHLQKEKLNGIWGNIIKNVFAPAFFDKFDYVVGNPPWINWQTLPESYRESIKKYWIDYKIFLHRGLAARLGSAHDDICVLMTYVILDNYLKESGKLAFVLPQNLFQSSGGGEGFRRFKIKEEEKVSVEEVDDFTSVQPFADMGASNKPCTVVFTKNKENKYPVKYYKWSKNVKMTFPSDQRLSAALPLLNRQEFVAEPLRDEEITSSWIISTPDKIKVLKKLVGKSNYRARKGVDTSLNGLFWGRIKSHNRADLIVFKNEIATSRKTVKQYEIPIEKELIYPILRGKNISRWKTSADLFSIIPYTKDGKCISKEDMQRRFPNAYNFFFIHDQQIVEQLKARGIYQKHLAATDTPVYGLYDIGKYTFSQFKVVWKALADGMIASVISSDDSVAELSNTMIIPDHNVLMVPIDNRDEAHYLCGILNSSIVSEFVKSYIAWFYSSHILENISIPNYDATDESHIRISDISKLAHEENGLEQAIKEELDSLVVKSLNH